MAKSAEWLDSEDGVSQLQVVHDNVNDTLKVAVYRNGRSAAAITLDADDMLHLAEWLASRTEVDV